MKFRWYFFMKLLNNNFTGACMFQQFTPHVTRYYAHLLERLA
jgi:hypothetical protein